MQFRSMLIRTLISVYGITGEPDTSATRHFGITKLVPKLTNHRWGCVSSWVEVSRLFLDHGTRVEVS